MPIKFRLSNLEMDEVSFVSAGDNPPARICLAKNKARPDTVDLGGPEYEQVDEWSHEDGTVFFKTAEGKVYQSDSYSIDDGEIGIDSATLLVDLNEDAEEEDTSEGAVDTPRLQKAFAYLWNAFSEMTGDDQPQGDLQMGKARFAETMQAMVAERAYAEMSDYCSALKGSLDMSMLSGEGREAMEKSLDEFNNTMRAAIEKWSSGQTLAKEVPVDVLTHADYRDREVLKGHIDEEDANEMRRRVEKGTNEEGEGPQGGSQGSDEKEDDNVAGIDRSKLSEEESAQLDQMEARLEQLEESSQAPVKGGVQQTSTGLAQPAGESRVAGPPDQAAGNYPTSVEDVVGDTGAHQAPWDVEKMMKGMPEGPQKELFKMILHQNQELAAERERATYVNKARGIDGVNPDEFGPVLQRIEKGRSTDEDAKYVLDVLRSRQAVEAHGEVITKQLSRYAGGDADPTSPREQLLHKAARIQADEGVSAEIAMGMVREDPANAALINDMAKEA